MYFSSSPSCMHAEATERMIENSSFNSGLDYVQLTWTCPKSIPEKYEINCLCFMPYTRNFQHKEIEIVNHAFTKISSSTTSFKIFKLRPNSTCVLKLLAVYNPASTDPGIVVTGTTSAENTGLCDFE